MIERRKSKRISVGGVPVGGDAPISVQSMTTTKTSDVVATLEEIARLEEAGCEMVRVAVPKQEDGRALGKIRAGINIPLIADVHFDYRMALIALDEGVDCLRLNPGNIGSRDRVEEVARKAAAAPVTSSACSPRWAMATSSPPSTTGSAFPERLSVKTSWAS